MEKVLIVAVTPQAAAGFSCEMGERAGDSSGASRALSRSKSSVRHAGTGLELMWRECLTPLRIYTGTKPVSHQALGVNGREGEVPPRLTALVRKELVRPEQASFAGDDAYRVPRELGVALVISASAVA